MRLAYAASQYKSSAIIMGKLFSERQLFMGSKIIGLVVRPLVLFLLLKSGRLDAATDFALLLTSVASSFVFLNNQNYRVAYAYFLDTDAPPRGLGGYSILTSYLMGTSIHIVLFFPFCVAFLWLWTDSAVVFLGASVLILSEKFFDDDQRVLIYKRRYYEWMLNFFWRIIFPSAIFLFCLLAFGCAHIVTYVGATLISLSIYILSKRTQFFRMMAKIVCKHIIKHPIKAIMGYLSDYKNEYALAQIWAVVTANVILIDRFLVSKARPEDFAAYVLLANIANIIATFHNLGYVTFQRPLLLRPKAPMLRYVFAKGNLAVPISLAITVFIGYIGMGALGIQFTILTIPVIGLLLILYVFHALSLIPKEIAFWRFRRIILLGCDLIAIAVPILSYLAFAQSIASIIIATIFGVSIRFILLIIIIHNPNPRTHL